MKNKSKTEKPKLERRARKKSQRKIERNPRWMPQEAHVAAAGCLMTEALLIFF